VRLLKRVVTFFSVKNEQTLAAVWMGTLSCNNKHLESRNLGIFKDSAITLDVILLHQQQCLPPFN
jgi:hypothetical protein